jgi:hypothetical protein
VDGQLGVGYLSVQVRERGWCRTVLFNLRAGKVRTMTRDQPQGHQPGPQGTLASRLRALRA